ncbi:MAG: hypothetical protein HYV76_02115 [Candidatus Vogelbacteria bacterium]|nr:hypothetical protein [Candidatus Vogelbacteria bacterium]
MFLSVFKVLAPTALAFFIGMTLTPFLTHYLYTYKLWKKKSGKVDLEGRDTPIFNELHKNKEVGTPRMGGVIIWVSTLITVILFWLFDILWPSNLSTKLNFLSREQTWLPIFTLLVGSVVGLIDDLYQVLGRDLGNRGLAFRKRLLVVVLLGLVGGWWFYVKLGVTSIFVPGVGAIFIGWWLVPLFIMVMIALFSSGVIDGLDGLAGGIMTIIFVAYAGISFFNNQIDLAALCGVVAGGTLAFLWFNIPPARFYMSETGILGLTTTLTVVAFLTDSVIFLPIIALPLVATSLSVIIQLASKKLRGGKKVFLVAPLHHHFEAIGWPATKVVMRYWIIGVIAAILGMILVLLRV